MNIPPHILILIAAVLTMLCGGCSHDLYVAQPFQTVRLVGDVHTNVTFPVRMADGSIQMVVTGMTLRDGFEAKQLTPDEATAEQSALKAAMATAATRPSK